MDDATLSRGLAAAQAYADAHYEDLNKPEALETSFKVQAYLPPKQ